MAKKRRLSDLYVTKRDVVFDDGEGDTIKVVVRKLNPIQHESALKAANAARARSMAALRDPESVEYLSLLDEVESGTFEEYVEVLLDEECMAKLPVIEAELEEDEEWTTDAYLSGLQLAWEEGLKDDYARDPEHEEAARVFAELKRFAAQVDKELDAYRENIRVDLEDSSEESLRQQVMDTRVTMEANAAWLAEFRRCEMWLSVKEEDGRTSYFENRSEVDSLPVEVLGRLALEYRMLSVEPVEGKDSREKDAS